MNDAVMAFNTQFEYQPEIVNADALVQKKRVIVCGMGGSHLNADLVKWHDETLPITVHSDYGLDRFSEEELQESLIIASSYSGNTEEVLSCYTEAKEKGLALAALSVGGKLIAMAAEDGVPHVQIPDTGIQPRSALGLSFRALLKLLGQDALLQETAALAERLDPASLEQKGKELAQQWNGRAIMVYTSRKNYTIAWNWKIKLNETGKIPAMYNLFPELNHNEMTGFDVQDSTKALSEKMQFVFIKDKNDHPKNQKRMDVCAKLYKDRELPVEEIELQGETKLEALFNSLILADWIAVYTAEQYGVEAEQVPMVEEFKAMIA